MSPRRFKRRTYIIVASGRAALTFSAATSASSARTTIRSAFPCTQSPTVNCQDILELLQSSVTGVRPHHRQPGAGCNRQAYIVADVSPRVATSQLRSENRKHGQASASAKRSVATTIASMSTINLTGQRSGAHVRQTQKTWLVRSKQSAPIFKT